MKKIVILVKSKAFINDFEILFPTLAEKKKAFKKAGVSDNTFDAWKTRVQGLEEGRITKDIFEKLCTVSSLPYEDYFIKEVSYRLNPAESKTKSKVKTTRLKNGVVITTTYANGKSKQETNTSLSKPQVSDKNGFALKITSFRHHMEIYRRLLGVPYDVVLTKVPNYADIEAEKEVLSIASYFVISRILMDAYRKTPDSALKTAFTDLAMNYNDIYIDILYFGDATPNKKRRKGGS